MWPLLACALRAAPPQASHCFLMEPVLNFGLEQQAIGRINRIGQSAPTVVERLVVDGTVEGKIVAMARRRQRLSARGSSDAEAVQLQAQEVADLFGL